MYVCICHAVTDGDIANAVSAGVSSVEELSDNLGLGTGCGSCVELAATVMSSQRGKCRDFAVRPGATAGVYRYSPAL